MRISLRHGDDVHTLELQKTPQGYRAVLADQSLEVQLLKVETGEFHLLLDGQPVIAQWAVDGPQRWVAVRGRTFILDKRTSLAARRPGDAGEERTLRAAMPGQVQAIQVGIGDEVTQGQTLLLLEAMKMEIRIQAPRPGRVARLAVEVGTFVERDQILVELV